MSQQRHIIGRTVLELNTSNLADVWSLQEEVSRLFQQQAVPEMERLFDRLVGTDEVVRLDRVVVEVGAVDRRFLADEFLRKLLSTLDQTLSDSLQESVLQNRQDNRRSDGVTPATTRDRAGADWEVLLYFLQYGRLPWWVTAGDWQDWFPRWEGVMQRGTNWRMSLLTLLASQPTARQRLVEQFPEAFRHQLIIQLQPAWTNWVTLLGQARQLMQDLGLSGSTVRQLEREAWLLLLAEVTPDSSLMQPLPAAIWMRNWLMQLVQVEQWEVATGIFEAGETPQAIAYQRLRVSLENIPSSERTLWLTAIDQVIASSSVDTPKLRSGLGIFLDFLQQGCIPAEQASVAWQEWLSRWEALMQRDTTWREPLRALLATNSAVRQRLVEQFPEAFRHQLIIQLQPAWTNWVTLLGQARQVMQDLGLSGSRVRQLEREAWLLLLAEITPDSSPMQPLPAAIWMQNWLMQLVQMGQGEGVTGILEAGETPQLSAYPRLRVILENIPSSERTLWLTALDQVIASSSVDTSTLQSDLAIFLDFLQQGCIPGEQASVAWREWLDRWEALMQNDATWREPLRALLATNPAMRQRLVEQFPEAFRHQLIVQLQPAWTNWATLLGQARQLMQDLGLSSRTRQQLEREAWLLLLAEVTSDSSLVQPLPAAIWMQNWLMQWVQMGQEELTTGISEAGDTSQVSTYQRLQSILETVPSSERTLWLTALDQVLASLSVDTEWRSNIGVETDAGTRGRGDAENKTMLPMNATSDEGSARRSDGEIWLDFLQQGYFPSEQREVDWREWLDRWEVVMQSDTCWREPLRVLLATNPAVRQRLVEQFPEAFRHQLVLQMQPIWTGWYRMLAEARQVMQSLNLSSDVTRHLERQAWLLLLTEMGLGSDTLQSLPGASWVRNWLAQLIQVGQESATSERLAQGREAGEQLGGNAEQRLRAILEAMSLDEPELWLSALDEGLASGAGDRVGAAQILLANPENLTPQPPTLAGKGEPESPSPPLSFSPTRGEDKEEFLLGGGVGEGSAPAVNSPTVSAREGRESEATEDAQQEERGGQGSRTPPRQPGRSTLSPEEETAGLYVNQAGIVLLHPFLRFYFEAVGLLDGESFRDEAAQQTAIYLLHYLATRLTDAPEYELVLPKLLCGWDLNEPVERGLDLPATMLAEGEHLLQTVIDYWEALKSTSPDGLREGFLQRAGKLTHGEGNWTLQVEQQAIDILLSRLPWGLSMVKLPWMEEILIVEWH